MGREGVECSHVARNSFMPVSSEHDSKSSVPITATAA